MSSIFSQAYALLVGVGNTAYIPYSLPITVEDMRALLSVLVDPALCGYPNDDEHIQLLYDNSATRQSILDGLTWLTQQTMQNPEATVVVYFSGHGWLNSDTGKYYLVPHDARPDDLIGSALPAEQFVAMLHKIQPCRLLVFMDCCHAAGMATSKDASEDQELPDDFLQVALPKGLLEELKQGQGRAVFSASSGSQKSWVRPQGDLSLYTYHLIEALHGAGSRPGETVVRLSDLMYYLGKTVPESAQAMGKKQTPSADLAAEDFPVAMLRGGKGLPGDPLAEVKKETEQTLIRLVQAGVLIGSNVDTGGGDFVGCDQNKVQANGERSAAIGGQAYGNTIITGNGNSVGSNNVSQVVKAEGSSTISGVTQVAGTRE